MRRAHALRLARPAGTVNECGARQDDRIERNVSNRKLSNQISAILEMLVDIGTGLEEALFEVVDVGCTLLRACDK